MEWSGEYVPISLDLAGWDGLPMLLIRALSCVFGAGIPFFSSKLEKVAPRFGRRWKEELEEGDGGTRHLKALLNLATFVGGEVEAA